MNVMQGILSQFTKMQLSDYLDIALVAFLIYKLLPLIRTPSTKRIAGAVAGILGGAVVDILWLVLLKDLGIYEIIPGFLFGLLAAVVVSLCTKAPDQEVTALFDRVNSGEEIDAE